ncbi:dethiobiotin synthase [Derxia gummosa]|uniref:ATP-dependent dethiobiotin synthetase BioD n=1 Tax=Derxia gummosa DSM 723 TaxID=1121388 RepID=A0A8B6X0K2_9BURK|nr:dethiobiotin synthase [Derxia gummosa]
MKALFVSGTDTGVGKTLASAWIARHWNATYWKPAQTGTATDDGDDSGSVARLAGVPVLPEAFRFAAPESPARAAELEGRRIDPTAFVLPRAPRLVVEGAGGLLVPVTDDFLMIDLARRLDLPVLLVARSGLGTINHTLLSAEALRARGMRLLGVVMSGEPNAANRVAIERHGALPVLAELPRLGTGDLAAQLGALPLPCALRAALDELDEVAG